MGMIEVFLKNNDEKVAKMWWLIKVLYFSPVIKYAGVLA